MGLLEKLYDLIGTMDKENAEEIATEAKKLIDQAEGEEKMAMMGKAEEIGMFMLACGIE